MDPSSLLSEHVATEMSDVKRSNPNPNTYSDLDTLTHTHTQSAKQFVRVYMCVQFRGHQSSQVEIYSTFVCYYSFMHELIRILAPTLPQTFADPFVVNA